jgi:predicted dehydrogenase
MNDIHKIRWGIIGAGHIARSFARDVNSLPDAEVLAVGSRSETNATQFADELHIKKAYGNYQKLVEDPDVDVVYIATPHVFHKEQSLLCLINQKAVLVEKPFAMTATEAQEVVSLAQKQKLFCMEGMWMRFIPAMQKAIEIIKGGAIGELLMISASLGFYNEFDPQSRLYDPNLGGGAVLDLGVYPISLIVQLMGCPNSISSRAKIGVTKVDEHFTALLGFTDGRSALISANINAQNQNSAFILGTKGSIQIEPPLYRPTKITLHQYASSKRKLAGSNPIAKKLYANQKILDIYRQLRNLFTNSLRINSIKLSCKGNGYGYQAVEVGRCLRAGLTESSIMPQDETIAVLEIVDAIRDSWSGNYVSSALDFPKIERQV